MSLHCQQTADSTDGKCAVTGQQVETLAIERQVTAWIVRHPLSNSKGSGGTPRLLLKEKLFVAGSGNFVRQSCLHFASPLLGLMRH